MNKKGIVQGFAFMIAILFSMFIVITLSKVIFTNLNDGGMFDGATESQDIADEFETSVYPAFDNLFLGTFIAGFLFLTLISFQSDIRTNKAYFPIMILVVVPIMLLVSTTISNAQNQFSDNAIWSSAESDNGLKTSLILDQLPLFVLGMSALLLLVVYGLNKQEGFA